MARGLPACLTAYRLPACLALRLAILGQAACLAEYLVCWWCRGYLRHMQSSDPSSGIVSDRHTGSMNPGAGVVVVVRAWLVLHPFPRRLLLARFDPSRHHPKQPWATLPSPRRRGGHQSIGIQTRDTSAFPREKFAAKMSDPDQGNRGTVFPRSCFFAVWSGLIRGGLIYFHGRRSSNAVARWKHQAHIIGISSGTRWTRWLPCGRPLL